MKRFCLGATVVAGLLASGVWAEAPRRPITLSNVKLIDGTGKPARDHVTIEIRQDKIVSIRSSGMAATSTRTVIPGLINAHGHVGLVEGTSVGSSNFTGVNLVRQLSQYERYGVTTVMALGMCKDSVYSFRSEQGHGNEPGSTLLTAGRGIGVPDGYPPVKVSKDQIYRPKTPEQARAAVQEMAAHSPNLIKIWVDDGLGKFPKMSPDIYKAVIEEAHRANLKVAAHVFYQEDARRLIENGIDILAHSVRDRVLDADTVSLIRSHNTGYIATLQLEESFYVFGEGPPWMSMPFFRNAVSDRLLNFLEDERKTDVGPHRSAYLSAATNVRKLHAVGIPVAFGTDSGANPYRIPGWAEHRELQLLVEAGLSPIEAIHAATGLNARLLGLADKTGTVEVGKAADLILLRSDPSTNIQATQQLEAVFHNGRKVESVVSLH